MTRPPFRRSLAWRALLIWLVVLVLANLNGALRELALTPRVGPGPAHILSTILLSGLVALTAYLAVDWIGPASRTEGWLVGTLWLALTLGFEFGAGHYLFRKPWPDLLRDYNLSAGRIWPLVLLVTLISPELFRRLRGGH